MENGIALGDCKIRSALGLQSYLNCPRNALGDYEIRSALGDEWKTALPWETVKFAAPWEISPKALPWETNRIYTRAMPKLNTFTTIAVSVNDIQGQ